MAEIEITYNGATVAQMNAGGSKTLLTGGKLCATNIGIRYNRPGISYLGANAVKIADYAAQTVALSSTDFATWTPDTTATTIKASSDAGTAALNTGTYNYALLWFFDMKYVYDGTETNTSKMVRECICIQQAIYKAPSGLTQLGSRNYNRNYCATMLTTGLADYWNGSGKHTLAYSATQGIYPSATAATFSSTTSNTPTLTVKRPSIRAICSSYLSTANCSKINKASSKYTLRGELWRLDKDAEYQGMIKNIVEMYNA